MSGNIPQTLPELKEAKWRELLASNPRACKSTFMAAWDLIWAASEEHARKTQEPVGHLLIGSGHFEEGKEDYHSGDEWEALYQRPIPVGENERGSGMVCIPSVAPEGLLNSMGMRHRHDFFMLPEDQKDSIRRSMRQLHEEVVGTGFWNYLNPSPLHLAGGFPEADKPSTK